MVKISLIGVSVVLAVLCAFPVVHAYYPVQAGPGMAPGVCPPSGCPPTMMPMQVPGYQPQMPTRITKCKPQPAPYCGPVACPPPTCAPVCMPVCKPPVQWY